MNDELVESLFKESDFFIPYYKQFKKYLKGNEILYIECEDWHQKEKLENLGFHVNSWNLDIAKHHLLNVDGALLFCVLENMHSFKIPDLIKEVEQTLKEEGVLLIVMKNEQYTSENLKIFLDKAFEFKEELASNEEWKFYLYVKKHC